MEARDYPANITPHTEFRTYGSNGWRKATGRIDSDHCIPTQHGPVHAKHVAEIQSGRLKLRVMDYDKKNQNFTVGKK